jgi:hypothetical protein
MMTIKGCRLPKVALTEDYGSEGAVKGAEVAGYLSEEQISDHAVELQCDFTSTSDYIIYMS